MISRCNCCGGSLRGHALDPDACDCPASAPEPDDDDDGLPPDGPGPSW